MTRFEYANLFHTVTDWYSAYVSSRVTGLPNLPHLIFVDGHCMVCTISFLNLFSFTFNILMVLLFILRKHKKQTTCSIFDAVD